MQRRNSRDSVAGGEWRVGVGRAVGEIRKVVEMRLM